MNDENDPGLLNCWMTCPACGSVHVTLAALDSTPCSCGRHPSGLTLVIECRACRASVTLGIQAGMAPSVQEATPQRGPGIEVYAERGSADPSVDSVRFVPVETVLHLAGPADRQRWRAGAEKERAESLHNARVLATRLGQGLAALTPQDTRVLWQYAEMRDRTLSSNPGNTDPYTRAGLTQQDITTLNATLATALRANPRVARVLRQADPSQDGADDQGEGEGTAHGF